MREFEIAGEGTFTLAEDGLLVGPDGREYRPHFDAWRGLCGCGQWVTLLTDDALGYYGYRACTACGKGVLEEVFKCGACGERWAESAAAAADTSVCAYCGGDCLWEDCPTCGGSLVRDGERYRCQDCQATFTEAEALGEE